MPDRMVDVTPEPMSTAAQVGGAGSLVMEGRVWKEGGPGHVGLQSLPACSACTGCIPSALRGIPAPALVSLESPKRNFAVLA